MQGSCPTPVPDSRRNHLSSAWRVPLHSIRQESGSRPDAGRSCRPQSHRTPAQTYFVQQAVKFPTRSLPRALPSRISFSKQSGAHNEAPRVLVRGTVPRAPAIQTSLPHICACCCLEQCTAACDVLPQITSAQLTCLQIVCLKTHARYSVHLESEVEILESPGRMGMRARAFT